MQSKTCDLRTKKEMFKSDIKLHQYNNKYNELKNKCYKKCLFIFGRFSKNNKLLFKCLFKLHNSSV